MSRRTPKSQRISTQNDTSDSCVRIIGGDWRSRKITFLEGEGLRPTPDRVKETLFNWLRSVTPGAKCLDLYSGSGALAFEALSRGATQATLVDVSAQVCRLLRENIQSLKAQNADVIQADAINWLKSLPADIGQRFDLVFIDPPFRKDLIEQIAELLESRNILANDAMIYIETEKELEKLRLPVNWSLYREKVAGQVCYRLYNRASEE